MPLVIRSIAKLSTASYHFPQNDAQHDEVPWLRGEIEEDGSLCRICARLNLPWLFENSLSEYSVADETSSSKLLYGIRLGSYVEISHRQSCEFCQLLSYTLQYWPVYDDTVDSDQQDDRDIYLINTAFSGSRISFSPPSTTGPYTMRLALVLTRSHERSLASLGTSHPMIHRIDEDGPPSRGLRVAKNRAELVRCIKDWVLPCLADPNPTNAGVADRSQSSLSLRFIDTKSWCIVGPSCGAQYYALSYTWGRIDPLTLVMDNELELRKEGALRRYQKRLPITIQDAITLCSMLGQRYLWVDSLCIVQDAKDKPDQIQQMDRIYREALVTIVAAAGMDGNAGLPGISRMRQSGQRLITVGNTCVANVLPSCGASLAASEWNWRGWTFQEGLLSTRKLIFTVNQTYYHCLHGECSEDTETDIHRIYALSESDNFRLSTTNVTNWTLYQNLVATYCDRKLSYESDALNAFAGIASHLSKTMFMSTPFVRGIPLCSLELGLLWQPSGPLHRRCGPETADPLFPSWSWAAWSGSLEYATTSELRNASERSISRIKLLGPAEGIVVGKPPATWDGWSRWKRTVVGENEDVYYIHEDLPDTQWFDHPIHTSIPQQQQQQQQSNITWSQLNLEADIVQLKLTGEHANLWYLDEFCDGGLHDVCRLQVYDQSDRKAGVVIMDGATFVATDFSSNGSLFSFIKISQTTLAYGEDDPAWDKETKFFKGIPGEPAIEPKAPLRDDEAEFDQDVYDRNICWCLYHVLVVVFEGGIGRRIAVGRVHIHAFDSAEPVREEVTLG